jgi:subtilisin family serine protease
MRLPRAVTAAGAALLIACCGTGATGRHGTGTAGPGIFAVGYGSAVDLHAALAAEGATLVRRVAPLHVAEVRVASSRAAALRLRRGIRFVRSPVGRQAAVAPASPLSTAAAGAEWQLHATHEDEVPAAVLQAAAAVRIAVIDTGADVAAPSLAAKHPAAYDVRTGKAAVPDANGHGTFVASLAAGSVGAGLAMVGSGGDARLLVVRSAGRDGTFTDVDEAAGIVYAVDHGARVVNLSLGGPSTSAVERAAVRYAAGHGVLLVAAVGNEHAQGDPVEYPAALLQPAGSNGVGGTGLAVAASTSTGERAAFSETGSTVSLAAPGLNVLGAVSRLSSTRSYPRATVPGLPAGLYGYGSGTSFAAPQVAGAAALVWGANPSLSAAEVAGILKATASGGGRWAPELGFGVIDVRAAVARAQAAAGGP